MTTILALDTSGDACSCALMHHGQLFDSFAIIPRQHAAQILPMIHKVMADAGVEFTDLDAIAFGQGPGSFTGLRIAAGVTQGIAYAANLPVVPVSTLAALAWQVSKNHTQSVNHVLSLIDARIDEIYWGLFDCSSGFPVLQGEEHLTAPELVYLASTESRLMNCEAIIATGSGLSYMDRLDSGLVSNMLACYPEAQPSASAIVHLADDMFRNGVHISAPEIVPVYLRDQVARKPG